MLIKAILFDIDGTLADSNDDHVRAWDQAFRDAGHRFDPQVIHDQIGKGTDMLVPTLLPTLDEAGAKALGEAHGRIFKARYLDRVTLFPHARDLLVRAHDRGQTVVLASSASKSEIDHYVALLDAHDLVDASTSGDDVARTKPAPDIFSTALGKLDGIGPAETIVVGDTPYDIEAARRCGIGAIGLRSGKFGDDVLNAAGAIAIYDDVAALLADYDRSPLAA